MSLVFSLPCIALCICVPTEDRQLFLVLPVSCWLYEGCLTQVRAPPGRAWIHMFGIGAHLVQPTLSGFNMFAGCCAVPLNTGRSIRYRARRVLVPCTSTCLHDPIPPLQARTSKRMPGRGLSLLAMFGLLCYLPCHMKNKCGIGLKTNFQDWQASSIM